MLLKRLRPAPRPLGTWTRAWLRLGLACFALAALALPKAFAVPVPASAAAAAPLSQGSAQRPSGEPQVVVVLAGGGAKGFAHLALLRRLERERVPIARLVGTSMGAVIGGLYASGVSLDQIEGVISQLDPGELALDRVDRRALPPRVREYQERFPIGLEFGIQDGGLGFARGVSDGQRFLALLQALTAELPSDLDFDDLPIPFRAVATRYRDGEMRVFRRGPLHLAIRASMAAPAVFAPIEIDGETYVDGGLVANLPIEVALSEGAEVVVASFLGNGGAEVPVGQAGNALAVANQMLNILIRQNERRNLALLRPQDVLFEPALGAIGFADFDQSQRTIALAEQALSALQGRLAALAWAAPPMPTASPTTLPPPTVGTVRVRGNRDVPEPFIKAALAGLVGKPFRAEAVQRELDALYTSGYFERVSYALQAHEQAAPERPGQVLLIEVQEKPYGPNFFKTSLGIASELKGVNRFSFGVGYRRPWLNPLGLELSIDARLGSESELSARLHQPIGLGLALEGVLGHTRRNQAIYSPFSLLPGFQDQKLGFLNVSRSQIGLDMVYRIDRQSQLKLGWIGSRNSSTVDTAPQILLRRPSGESTPFYLRDASISYGGIKLQAKTDHLDSRSFPTSGHYLSASLEQGLVGASFRSLRLSANWALPVGAHSLNLGINLGRDDQLAGCVDCANPNPLYMGGFQLMGAYRTGQLSGDRLAHLQATYMYQLFDGGLLRQKTHLGLVLEAGDAWQSGSRPDYQRSATLFLAVDSAIGDIYLGLARGSAGATNAFVQLGRRFGF